MKNIVFLLLILLSLNIIADDKIRPGPHNKMGHTKQSEQDKKDSFFYKLFNNELDLMNSSSETNNEILLQIEKLADLNERGILTNSEFKDKKLILLEKIK